MKKRLFCLSLLLLLAAAFCFTGAFADGGGTVGDNLTWTLDS